MQSPHWRGGSGGGAPPHEGKQENEEAILDTMLSSMARGALPSEAWERLHAAAQREHRLSELAFGFESVSQGKRLKTLPPPVAAEFFFQAAHFFGDVFSDELGAVTYLERALALSPTHSASFEKIEQLLQKTEQSRKLSEVYAAAAQHRPRSEQAPLLRRAAELLSKEGGEEEKTIEILQQLLRLEPGDVWARGRLEALYMGANRLRDVARLNEQALTSEPPPDLATRKKLLARIIEVYSAKLNEPERALPHVEQLLAIDPIHEDARKVAGRLVGSKGLAARAAAALAKASEQFGTPEETSRYLSVELEHTRGTKRVGPLLKLGALKHDKLGDSAGALQALEQAMAIDPTGDELRARYLAIAAELGAWVEASKTLERALATVKDPAVKAKLTAQLGEVLQRRGETKRATHMLSAVLAAPEAPAEAVLAAAHALREIHEAEGDTQALCDALEWIVELEPDAEKRLDADERLAELAAKLGDSSRAIASYERLLSTDARARALEALVPLYEASAAPDKRARLLEEQSRDAADPTEARTLMMNAAELRERSGAGPSSVIAAYEAVVERFGPAADVLDRLVVAYEEQERWDDLGRALGQKAELCEGAEKARILVRLGTYLARQRDPHAAVDAFARAIAADPSEPTARKMLERFLKLSDHRLTAARALEPVYRSEQSSDRLLELLELIAETAPDVEARLAAWSAAADVCERSETESAGRLAELLGRGLTESIRHGREAGPWLERIENVLGEFSEPKHQATVLGKAIGDHDVISESLGEIAKRAAHAHAACGEVETAIKLYRRVLAFDSDDTGARESLAEIYWQGERWDDLAQLLEERLPRLVGSAAREARGGLLRVALAQGNAAQARQRCDELLADPDLPPELLDEVERAAHELDDAAIARAVAARGAPSSPLPLELPKLYESLEEHSPPGDGRASPWLSQALALYERVLESESRSDAALAAAIRLARATGDIEKAVSALRAYRERVEGSDRIAIDIEIARTLLSRSRQPAEAVSVLRAVLSAAPGSRAARGLAARLLGYPDTRADAIQMLEHACSQTDDRDARVQILRSLVDSPPGSDEEDIRGRWLGWLCDVQRDGGAQEDALATAIRAVREQPDAAASWDRAEQAARALSRPDEVSALYDEVLARPLTARQVLTIGQRAVQFHDEWFENSLDVVPILRRVLEREPSTEWAFNRLKLLLDSAERWDELFALYDWALDSAPAERRAALLEEAALTAKDFADRPDDAIRYIEELAHDKQADEILSSALERLYERRGRHRELVALLTARLPLLPPKERLHARSRIATLSLDELGDPAAALGILEPALRGDEAGQEASADEWSLLERILAAAPASGDSVMTRTSVRQRAAARLREHYANVGAEADLVRMVLVQLEAARSVEERLRCHLQVAEISEGLGDAATALDHVGVAASLDPGDEAKRAKLVQLAVRTGRYDSLADFLAAAAAKADKPALYVALTIQAAAVRCDPMGDDAGAIALLTAALAKRSVANVDIVAIGRRLEALFDSAGRSEERLDVLDRIAMAEPDGNARRETLGKAGHLAARLGQNQRAIAFWQKRLDADGQDAEALDGLVDLFGREGQSARLADVLGRRARLAKGDDRGRTDRVRVARLLSDVLARPADAVEAWREIERDFGETDDALVALTALLRSTQRWQELVDLLERASARAPDDAARAEFLRQTGDVQFHALGSLAAATASYTRSLKADPRNAGARAGLLALAAEDAYRVAAVDVLLAALRKCDDWKATEGLAELRLLAAESESDRVAILLEAMEIAETRAGDQRLALDAVLRAFAIAPGDRHVQGELTRLAEAVGAWQALVDAYSQAIVGAARDDATLVAQLRAWAGAVLETRLDDPRGALHVYLRVVADTANVDAGGAAVRVAGQLSEWPVAAKVVVDLARALGEVPRDLLGAYELAATASGFWDEAASAIEESVSAAELSGPAARDLEARIAEWHRDRRGDPAAAQAAFHRALVHDEANATLLTRLAELQRRTPGAPLVETLLRLSQAAGGDLPLLREAAEVARDKASDARLAERILSDLLAIATARCTANDSDGQAVAFAEWAIEGLARLHEQQGDARALVDVLTEGDRLPVEPVVRRSMRRRAARVALEQLKDHEQAIALYLSLFVEDAQDAEAVDRLSSIYSADGRTRELLSLREQQIELAADSAHRVALRLEVARLLVGLGDSTRAAQVLRENLEEEPSHSETVEALASVFVGQKRSRELCELLEEQALGAEAAGDEARAADYWSRAASVAEQDLSAPEAAENYHTRVAALDPRIESLDALARLATARGDHADAALWLERLFGVVPADSRNDTLIRLCDALIASDQGTEAVGRLESALATTPAAEPLRARLAALYRERGAWGQLARLVRDGASHSPDTTTRLARLLEAASLFSNRCDEPAMAVPLLERASALTPDDHAIRLALAEALKRADCLDEARTVLRTVITTFGRRRPKSRANVHYQLARLELVDGDAPSALVELETAAAIDQENQAILRALAEAARDAGQFERAEKAYRALLDVLRRREEVGQARVMPRSEVLLELHSLAEHQGNSTRAHEILESALEMSAREDVDGARANNGHGTHGVPETIDLE